MLASNNGATSSRSYISYDWMLVFRNAKEDDHIVERTTAVRKLKAAGLAPTVCKSHDGKEVHVFIRSPQERLEMEAEMAGLKKLVLEDGGLAPFSIAKRHFFVGATSAHGMFSSAERQRLTLRSMISSTRLHGAQLDFEQMYQSGNLLRVVPVHDVHLRKVNHTPQHRIPAFSPSLTNPESESFALCSFRGRKAEHADAAARAGRCCRIWSKRGYLICPSARLQSARPSLCLSSNRLILLSWNQQAVTIESSPQFQ